MEETFLQLFPKNYREKWNSLSGQVSKIREIRLRAGGPIIVHLMDGERYLGESGLTKVLRNAYKVDEQELNRYLNHFCQDSIFAFQEEIKQGYITLPGGHRVGVAGRAVVENGTVVGMKNIGFLNIRLSHQVKGAADAVLPYIYDKKQVQNVLIISPPGCGKTTMLRDLIRQISDGNAYGEGVSVSVIDERSELAGTYQGKAQNDLGIRADVLDGCPKKEGLLMMLRSMAPRVIAVDELGGRAEEEALFQLAYCGVSILATVHGSGMEDINGKIGWARILEEKLFDRYIVLGMKDGKPAVLEIYGKEKQRLFAC